MTFGDMLQAYGAMAAGAAILLLLWRLAIWLQDWWRG